ncbi:MULTISPECIES: N-acetylneuraminate synthase [unclassified Pseudomonas]|uniref:N-acetylneuraminate synthase n=1 Tax=unclassified Pseudomonas TaxID=196821 RepID=UPI0021C5C485|nr:MULTISPECIES: N-acetylneuraminate synthase [unclassified Pseudomonas]MCU1733992.1 N-acetylneuraminate synthase [Pseudomonas sp. 20P_3.2_Bac4]MCU1742340.1 N-acetylneuraminate synthase [Pseudomonas sp. 20P_3.2_Bac5]
MKLSDASAVYIIAEAGVNHNGERDLAYALVDAAADAGVDAVKFQTFDAERLASKAAPKASYQKQSTDASESQLAMLKKLELPKAWHFELQAYARSKGIEFLSTAFDSGSLQFLCEMDLPFFKIPSGELTNGPLLWQFAHTGKPLVLSTGMATMSEVEQGLAIIAHALASTAEPGNMDEVWKCWSDPVSRQRLQGHVTLLHCTSQYPTPAHEVNLLAMDTLRAFGLPVGYSDHTEGCLIPVAAVARGASVIEKHFTLDRSMPGPDHKASLEPDELKSMVSQIRALQLALGDPCKVPQPSEWDTRKAARQQVVAARDIAAGAIIARDDLTTARSGSGLPPTALWELVGSTSRRAFGVGEIIEK